ncbi:serine hydrolase domain-containing protein [Pseudonocardia sp. HH130630-07]|uniref:serine hydrolase domain-containing protein n=1 Tax=Pseudonocardia sp. HH130630-07 TaxID=1690815 RepID=UPI000A92BA56|nr:serine hydrolase domain-containing protein [Pseudonocardia sp. HH130630-07]
MPELAGTPAGAVTLQELATHTSGLPPVPPAVATASVLPALMNENPYDVSTAALIDATRTTPTATRGSYAYSNLGISLLGHAEARAAGAADWSALVRERLLDPLGMQSTRLTTAGPDDALAPMFSNGWRAPSWWGRGSPRPARRRSARRPTSVGSPPRSSPAPPRVPRPSTRSPTRTPAGSAWPGA